MNEYLLRLTCFGADVNKTTNAKAIHKTPSDVIVNALAVACFIQSFNCFGVASKQYDEKKRRRKNVKILVLTH